jgi:hypothetical protein
MKGFSSLDNPSHEGKTNIWLTPLPLVYSLGVFDLDPCGYKGHETANEIYYPPNDGLSLPWHGRIWLNPPYGKNIGKWLIKLQNHGNGIGLVFSRTDTNWFHNCNPDAIFFIKGRIKFLKPDKSLSTNAGHGSILLIFGQHNIKSVINSKINGKFMFNKYHE